MASLLDRMNNIRASIETFNHVNGTPSIDRNYLALRMARIHSAKILAKEFDELNSIMYAIMNKVWVPKKLEERFDLEEPEEEEPQHQSSLGWIMSVSGLAMLTNCRNYRLCHGKKNSRNSKPQSKRKLSSLRGRMRRQSNHKELLSRCKRR